MFLSTKRLESKTIIFSLHGMRSPWEEHTLQFQLDCTHLHPSFLSNKKLQCSGTQLKSQHWGGQGRRTISSRLTWANNGQVLPQKIWGEREHKILNRKEHYELPNRGWGFSPVVERLPSKHKALGSVSALEKKKKKKTNLFINKSNMTKEIIRIVCFPIVVINTL
jgi:hypothetical protein